MDVCDKCGRLFLSNLRKLRLVEVEDRWGVWTEWLCESCFVELLRLAERDPSVDRVTMYDFSVGAAG